MDFIQIELAAEQPPAQKKPENKPLQLKIDRRKLKSNTGLMESALAQPYDKHKAVWNKGREQALENRANN